jgi:triosephosphate isomerase
MEYWTHMRKPLIAGNWKMYKTPQESAAFFNEFVPLLQHHKHDIAIFPATPSLAAVIDTATGSHIAVGGQNMHWLAEGAYTGETSPTMLQALGATHVLIGHSERRQYFNETDETVNLKLKSALAYKLVPVVCVGETRDKRESGLTEAVLNWQIAAALNSISAEQAESLIIAYEPVWAIGTGLVATTEQAAEAHGIIRREIARHLGQHRADATRILYGGSVKPDNIAKLMAEPEIDGALVGGASLAAKSFAEIVHGSVRSYGEKS